MAPKKRKETSTATEDPPKIEKKVKTSTKKESAKSKNDDKIVENAEALTAPTSVSKPAPATSASNAATTKTMKNRKRAADFMAEDEADSDGGAKVMDTPAVPAPEEPAKKKAKKTSKAKKSKGGESLTADGVNGVIEHTGEVELETATTQKPVKCSMQAEAERTVDHELEAGFTGFASEDEGADVDVDEVEADDNAAALLAGFDSDTEDKQEDKDLDTSKTPALSKKVLKKLAKARAKLESEGPGAVYVGRIPHGFYEKEMRAFFSQFGDISQLRLSRNKWTGASKHFAFIEFAHDSVAKIAAEAMDNYLMFGHVLKCKYAEPGSLHPDVWKGANKKYRKIPHEKLERERLAAPKTEEQWQKKIDKEQRKRDQKAEKLKVLGLDMPASTLTAPSAALQHKLADQEETAQIDAAAASASAIEPSADVPMDEATAVESKKPKRERKNKTDTKPDEHEPKQVEVAAGSAEDKNEHATNTDKKPKKDKKSKKGKKEEVAVQDEPKQVEEDATPAGAIEPPANVPKDEVAIKVATKPKKEKKSKKDKQVDAEADLDATTAAQPVDADGGRLEPENAGVKVGATPAEDETPVIEKAKPTKSEKKALAGEKKAAKQAKRAAENADQHEAVADAPPAEGAESEGQAEQAVNDTADEPKKKKQKLTKEEKRVLQADKRAANKAKKLAEKSNPPEPTDDGAAAEETSLPEVAESAPDAKADLSADFISLGHFEEDDNKSNKQTKPWKVKKPKKERKNLVKARGPKSKLVSTKPKPDPNATGKIPGLPLLGKGKYDKATRNAHKELKKRLLAERAARGLPPHRVRGE